MAVEGLIEKIIPIISFECKCRKCGFINLLTEKYAKNVSFTYCDCCGKEIIYEVPEITVSYKNSKKVCNNYKKDKNIKSGNVKTNEYISMLVNLGYNRKTARSIVYDVINAHDFENEDDLVRAIISNVSVS